MNGTSKGAHLGFEAKLWAAADALHGNMDAAEYKHVVLGLIFLKYISDAFEERHARVVSEQDQGADPEDSHKYRTAHVFWVPKEAHWALLKSNAKQPAIGKLVDDAMVAIERDWCSELLRDDERWQYGVPVAGNANFTWTQHAVRRMVRGSLAPVNCPARIRFAMLRNLNLERESAA